MGASDSASCALARCEPNSQQQQQQQQQQQHGDPPSASIASSSSSGMSSSASASTTTTAAIPTAAASVTSVVYASSASTSSPAVAAAVAERVTYRRHFALEYMLAAAATCGATVVSNPMEVVKTRMQLHGELTKDAAHVTLRTLTYQTRSFVYNFFKIAKLEGLHGLQRGLVPSMGFQATMNGPRLGLFEPFQRFYGATDPTSYTYPLRNICAAATSGVIGVFFGSPFYLVKTRIQAQSAHAQVNAQYHYNGLLDGFRQIIAHDGFRGLYRGMNGAIPRVAVGSSVQLTTYSQAKQMVMATTGIQDGVAIQFGASMLAGLALVSAMNPFDVVSTRLYSQRVVNGKGVLYDGVWDCFQKTFRAEGLRGFYKGWTAQYFRLGPHTVFTFLLWEQAKQVATWYGY